MAAFVRNKLMMMIAIQDGFRNLSCAPYCKYKTFSGRNQINSIVILCHSRPSMYKRRDNKKQANKLLVTVTVACKARPGWAAECHRQSSTSPSIITLLLRLWATILME